MNITVLDGCSGSSRTNVYDAYSWFWIIIDFIVIYYDNAIDITDQVTKDYDKMQQQ